MADASRALQLHEVGATPASSRSIPVTLVKAPTPSVAVVPAPPSGAGPFKLQAVSGVLSWVPAT